MENTQLPQDFKDFLTLLNANATHDMDIWIAVDDANAEKMIDVMKGFGFEEGGISKEVFLRNDAVVRMGVPPLRLEILMGISGVTFEECYEGRLADDIDGVPVEIINLEDLLKNKIASGRHKDLDDVSNLPKRWSK